MEEPTVVTVIVPDASEKAKPLLLKLIFLAVPFVIVRLVDEPFKFLPSELFNVISPLELLTTVKLEFSCIEPAGGI